MDLADYVNELPPSARLGSLSSYMEEQELPTPIDMYRQGVSVILSYGTERKLKSQDFLGRLLILGLVSAAEGYFRSVLASCIELCPVAQSAASGKTINLGGLLWHGKSGFSRSAFEHASFASKEELSKACKDFLGIKLSDATFKSLLDEFDIVCQLRHGIVHGDGILPGRNAVQLDIPRFSKPARITIRYRHLQEVAAVINTLVLTLNRELFVEMCKRWAIDWRKRADWDPALEGATFARIWSIFHSSDERQTRAGRSKITKARCMADVKAQYGI